jgi:uncharacterized glyoxalase superfamily protein PhnB
VSEPQNPTPSNWPRISSALYYDDARAAIDWLCRAFGFSVRLLIDGEGGGVEHSELLYGEGLIMVGQPKPEKFPQALSPSRVGGANTQSMMVYVDDVEAHCARARAAGAVIVKEPSTVDYGEEYWMDRGYECRDIGGHHWWFYQRLRSPKSG